MKICRQCDLRYKDDVKFCPECGSKLEIVLDKQRCKKCGLELEPFMLFCPECGEKMEILQEQKGFNSIDVNKKIDKKDEVAFVNAQQLIFLGIYFFFSFIGLYGNGVTRSNVSCFTAALLESAMLFYMVVFVNKFRKDCHKMGMTGIFMNGFGHLFVIIIFCVLRWKIFSWLGIVRNYSLSSKTVSWMVGSYFGTFFYNMLTSVVVFVICLAVVKILRKICGSK